MHIRPICKIADLYRLLTPYCTAESSKYQDLEKNPNSGKIDSLLFDRQQYSDATESIDIYRSYIAFVILHSCISDFLPSQDQHKDFTILAVAAPYHPV